MGSEMCIRDRLEVNKEIKNPDVIYPGQEIRIPRGSGTDRLGRKVDGERKGRYFKDEFLRRKKWTLDTPENREYWKRLKVRSERIRRIKELERRVDALNAAECLLEFVFRRPFLLDWEGKGIRLRVNHPVVRCLYMNLGKRIMKFPNGETFFYLFNGGRGRMCWLGSLEVNGWGRFDIYGIGAVFRNDEKGVELSFGEAYNKAFEEMKREIEKLELKEDRERYGEELRMMVYLHRRSRETGDISKLSYYLSEYVHINGGVLERMGRRWAGSRKFCLGEVTEEWVRKMAERISLVGTLQVPVYGHKIHLYAGI